MLKGLDSIHKDLYNKIECIPSDETVIMVDIMDLHIYLGAIQGVMVALGDERAFIAPTRRVRSEVYPRVDVPATMQI